MRARLAHQRGRALLSAAGIALGVALGFAVHLVNGAALNEFSLAVRTMAGEADFEVRGGRAGFGEALYPVLAGEPGVAVASPMLDLDAALAEDPQRMFELLKPDTVLLSPGAAAALKLNAGDRLALLAGLERVELEVVGIVPGLRGNVGLTDLATAQWRLKRLGNLNRIDLRLVPGADAARMRERVAALLPPGAYVAEVSQMEDQGANLSRAYRVNLNVLALVALFTGGFLVFSAQALEVARRRAEHAKQAVLGLTRSGVVRLVLAEAAVIGAVGSAAGLVLGYALARLAVRAAGG
ncbi:MAG: FtsX-like permease family protein, partial [Betaproteobacteria bacterium]|nr:FtsX-like permease family protein [Betaproteobacteria bacterium]